MEVSEIQQFDQFAVANGETQIDRARLEPFGLAGKKRGAFDGWAHRNSPSGRGDRWLIL
jgi:hypothetical protein